MRQSKKQADQMIGSINLKNFYQKIPFHVLFFIIYPILSLYVTNRNQIPSFAILRTSLFILCLTLIMFVLSFLFVRKALKAALLTTVLSILFNFYGHIYQAISQIKLNGVSIARHSVLTILWISIAVITVMIIVRLQENIHTATQIFNLVGAFLVLISFSQLMIAKINGDLFTFEKAPVEALVQEGGVNEGSASDPDIYYIIVDAYTNNEILMDKLGYDNSAIVEDLESQGFEVFTNARSNYDKTFYSLVSSLNMDYMDNLGVSAEMQDFDNLMPKIGDLYPHSRVRTILEDRGYSTIAFHLKAPWANFYDADIFYMLEEMVPYNNRLETLSFHDLYLKTTWVRFLYDTGKIQKIVSVLKSPTLIYWIDPNNYGGVITEDIRYLEYQKNRYSLDTLQKIPEIPGKKFVYAHLMTTHSSFVFNEDGSYKVETDESNEAYVEQIKFLNKRLVEITQTILRDSEIPPIIIIQGDHGFLPKEEKVGIIHALYFPDGGSEMLYPGMTPVNTFRSILNYYFDYDFERLPDRSFYIDTAAKKFIEVYR
jgi:sulfatase-like protein